jgi:subtilisin family serine protease
MNIISKYLLPFSCLFLSSFSFSQTLNNTSTNQLYFKLNSLENLSDFSWKQIEDNSQDIPQDLFPFKNFLDSIGVINISQPFGKKKEFTKLYLTFLAQLRDDYPDFNKLIKRMESFSEIDYSEPKYLDFLDFQPNDPSLNSCWHLSKIQAFDAWSLGTGSDSVVVAVVDDALEINHLDLTNVIWNNHLEIPNNGIDDDNNGYVDDYNGYDVADNDNNPNPPNTNLDHGTHVAGISGAQTNNNIGVASIGFGISIMPVKATRDNNFNGTINNAYDGVYYAALNGADIINCSWGSSNFSNTNYNIIQMAQNQGSIIVASAGNSNQNLASNPRYPSCYNGVVCVANTTQSDAKRGSSCYGSRVDISAPGSSILSTIPFNNYGTKSGTSMSAPMVAGLLGLMKSFSPNSTNEQLISCMKSASDNIDAINPSYAGLLGNGRINAYNALLCLSPPNADFKIIKQDSCSGEVQFSDATLGVPKSWAWDFDGDGIIDDTTRTARRYFNHLGSYNTTLTVTNDYGTDTKTVQNAFNITLSDAPLIDNEFICLGDSIFLKTNEYNNLNWYKNENDFDQFQSGLELITEPIYNDTSFFISELSDTSCYSTGLNYFPSNGSNSSNYSYLLFDVFQKMTLKSVDVKSTGSQDRTIIILDSSNQIIFEKTFNNFNTGVHTLNLNATIFPGNNYKIGLSPNSPVNLFRANSGASFPYEIPGLLSITKSMINPINTSTQQYYYFFNWEVCDPICESQRSEVKIFTDVCENIQDLQDVVIFPNPNTGIFTIRVPKNQTGNLKVVNMLGQTVYENSFSALVERVFVNIPSLSKGVYNLSVFINNKTVVRKFSIVE